MLSGLSSRAAQINFLRKIARTLVPGGGLCILVRSWLVNYPVSGVVLMSLTLRGPQVNNPDTYGTRFTSVHLAGPDDDAGDEEWEPGRVCKATFFDPDGHRIFACNDKWWPR